MNLVTSGGFICEISLLYPEVDTLTSISKFPVGELLFVISEDIIRIGWDTVIYEDVTLGIWLSGVSSNNETGSKLGLEILGGLEAQGIQLIWDDLTTLQVNVSVSVADCEFLSASSKSGINDSLVVI